MTRRPQRLALLPGTLLALAMALGPGCAPGSDVADPRPQALRPTGPSGAPGRLLVLRLREDGVEVVQQRPLARAPRPPRGRTTRWQGRFEVRDARGRVLATGPFRLSRVRHALFGAVDGPAEGVTVAVPEPVVFFRVPTPPGAVAVTLYDERGRARLGEVAL